MKPDQMASKPEEVGIDSERLEAVFARSKLDVDEGWLPSVQIAVARQGKIAGMRAFGSAVQGGRIAPATDDTLYVIFSCTKALVAAAIWLLFEKSLLRLDERVADIIPEFGTNGKEIVTVEQVLLHTAGFPYAPFPLEHYGNRAKMLEDFTSWQLEWEPGSRWEYHPWSAHWVLTEIIFRRTGSDYRRFIRERITGPLELDDIFIGLPPDENARVADVCYIGVPVEPPDGWRGVPPEHILEVNTRALREVGFPGGGGIANAASLAVFYQALINGGQGANGRRILEPESIAFGTTVRTTERHTDAILNILFPVNRGLSIQVAGDDGAGFMRGFGKAVSPRAFGHAGAGGQVAWGDPETGISVCELTNGFGDLRKLAERVTAVSGLAAVCAIGDRRVPDLSIF